jgi:hypothetical protein
MRHNILFGAITTYLVASCLFSTILVACGDDTDDEESMIEKEKEGKADRPDIIEDWCPFALQIKLVDSNYVDMLDKDLSNNLLDYDYRLEYNGEIYHVNPDPFKSHSRYYMPTFYGLYYQNDEVAKVHLGGNTTGETTKYTLCFGEFDRLDTLNLNVSFYVPWREAPYKITASHMLQRDDIDNYNDITTLTLDGASQSESPIKIVIPADEMP